MVARESAQTGIAEVGAVHRTARSVRDSPKRRAIEVNRPYLVKINFAPAMTSTVASKIEMARTGKRRLPR